MLESSILVALHIAFILPTNKIENLHLEVHINKEPITNHPTKYALNVLIRAKTNETETVHAEQIKLE